MLGVSWSSSHLLVTLRAALHIPSASHISLFGALHLEPPHCHTFTVLSTEPVTKMRPRRSRVVTKWEWALSSFLTHRAEDKSQTRTLLSSLPLRRYLPPLINTMSFTQLSWPIRVTRQRPLLASQIFIVLSRDPDARYSLANYSKGFFSSFALTYSVGSSAPIARFSRASFLACRVLFIYWIFSAVVNP